jgi:hypothetical protein
MRYLPFEIREKATVDDFVDGEILRVQQARFTRRCEEGISLRAKKRRGTKMSPASSRFSSLGWRFREIVNGPVHHRHRFTQTI